VLDEVISRKVGVSGDFLALNAHDKVNSFDW